MPRDYRLYLDDILLAAARVSRYIEGLSIEAFVADEKTLDAVIRNLEVVGEAVKSVPGDIRALSPGIDWRRISGLRTS